MEVINYNNQFKPPTTSQTSYFLHGLIILLNYIDTQEKDNKNLKRKREETNDKQTTKKQKRQKNLKRKRDENKI
jgi:hypothetical protein